MTAKKIIIIAGPNGAGKTTFAKAFLPDDAACPIFINADLIAQGLSPFQPESVAIRAGKLMLEEIGRQLECSNSFAFETTLSGRSYAKRIKSWRSQGYHVKLFFLSLSSVEVAISRVAMRVKEGGHNIPEAVIRRRYITGRSNFENIYCSLVDEWALYDNSGEEPILLAEGINNG